MIAKITSSMQFQAVMQRMPMDKVIKVALGALSLFALCLSAAVIYRRWETPAFLIPQALTEAVNKIPPQLVELLGGNEKFGQYPFKSYPRNQIKWFNFKASPIPAGDALHVWERIETIVSGIRDFIFKGVDEWGHSFVVIQIQDKENKDSFLQGIFYQYKDEWYWNEEKIFGSDGKCHLKKEGIEQIKELVSSKSS